MKVKRLKLLSPLFILAFVLALVMVAPPLASPAEAATPELYYDDGTPYDYIGGCQACSRYQGVRFSLPEGVTSANVTAVRFYYNYSGNVTIHITDSDHETDLTDPIAYYVNETGWCDVDVSGVTVSDDFYVVIRRWEQGRNPAYDDDSNCGRSFYGGTLGGLTNLMPGNLLIRAVISFANPAQWHVSTTGSDTEGDGSLGNPWRTIQYAVYHASVSSGDTIIVHEGTYTENVYVDKSLTIQAAAGENVTVQAADPNVHVFAVTADNVNISGFTVTGATGSSRAGIYLGSDVGHCNITNNTASGNYHGIYLFFSSGNTIEDNTASGNEWFGIYLYYSSNNTLSGNTASDNEHYGIYLYDSSNNTIEGNNTVSDNGCGIYLEYSSDNTISNNTASGNDYGVYLYDSSDNTISNNTASGNEWTGILLSHSSNNTISGNTANGNNEEGITLSHSSNNNTVSGNNTASDNEHYGIYLYQSSGNTIEGNTASNNEELGIFLQYSNNNIIENNTASENGQRGIYLYDSSNNTISGNTANGNNNHGIRLSYSSNNTLSGNIANENNSTGIYLDESSNNTLSGNNTASDNSYYGIYLYESSNNTLSGNTANGNNNRGICLSYSSNNTLSGNTALGNDFGIFLELSSDNTLSGNTASDNGYGIYLWESNGNTIEGDNTASGNEYRGISLRYSSDNNTFLNNTVHDNGHGIYIEDSSGNLFLGNDIRGNTAEEDSGVHLSGDAADNQFLFNNIVDNTAAGSYGVYNKAADIVNATLNWWGAASGPYHPTANPDGTGDAVSGNVTFEPWLGASVVGVIAEDITGAQTGVEISGPTGSDTTLTVDTSDDVTVIVALYSGNPHEEPFPDIALGKYIDIYASDPSAIDWPVRVEMSYTEDEVAAAGIDESTLGLYYWDASANEFQRCEDTGVDTASNIIWANVDEDEASGLAGTPFAPGGAAPGGLSGGAIAGIIVGAIAGAALIFFAVRKWVWKS